MTQPIHYTTETPTTRQSACDWCASFQPEYAPKSGPTIPYRCHGEDLEFHDECLEEHTARFTCAFHGDVD
jgi:hypothetical protein